MKASKMIAALGTAAVLCAGTVAAQPAQDTGSSDTVTAQTDTQYPSDTETAEDELLLRKKGENMDSAAQSSDSTATAEEELPLPSDSTQVP